MHMGLMGGNGRMGQQLMDILAHGGQHTWQVYHQGESVKSFLQGVEGVIDFSHPEATEKLLEAALEVPKPLVIGTTGLSILHHKLLDQVAQKTPLLQDTNMSLGLQVLKQLVSQAAKLLPRFYEVEISELHHRHKKDAPSGTALSLGDAVCQARKLTSTEVFCFDRTTRQTARPQDEIGFSVQRAGAVVGDHQVSFVDDEDMITLTHRGFSRGIYAKGALHALQWLKNQAPGRYNMAHVTEI